MHIISNCFSTCTHVVACACVLFVFRDAPASAQQTFYVDFDTSLSLPDTSPGKPIPAWRYAYDEPGQRAMILDYLNMHFSRYGMTYVEGLPPTPFSGSTITLNSPGFGAGSEGIDFRNIDDDDGATINILSILEFLGEDLSSPGFTDADVAMATANVIGHESSHLMGARHHDAHGPIGTGIGPGTTPSDFLPPYVGPIGAPETGTAFAAVHAGGANFGLSGLYSPNFISERAAVKLEFGSVRSDDYVIAEGTGNNTVDESQFFEPTPFAIPYPYRPEIDPETLPPGEDPPLTPDFLAGLGMVIIGSIDTPAGEGFMPDYYSFFGMAGQKVSIEAMSYILPGEGDDEFRYADNADPTVVLLDSGVLPVTGGINDDDDDTPPFGDPDFLGSASLIDVTLPETGLYTIEVVAPGPLFPVMGSDKTGMDGGAYELLIYAARPVVIPEPTSGMLLGIALAAFGKLTFLARCGKAGWTLSCSQQLEKIGRGGTH